MGSSVSHVAVDADLEDVSAGGGGAKVTCYRYHLHREWCSFQEVVHLRSEEIQSLGQY